MRVSRAVAVGVAAWVAVAGVGSAMTWTVISRAGSEVVSPATAVRDPGSAARSPRADRPARTQPGRPGRGAAGPGEGASSAPPTPGTAPSASSPSSPSSPSSQPSDPAPGTAAPAPDGPTSSPYSPSPSGTSTDRQRTWQGPGGTVVVTCRGDRAELDAAQPDSGYQVRVRDRGPDRVEVEFEGQDGAETRVRAECVSGEPRFEVDVDDD